MIEPSTLSIWPDCWCFIASLARCLDLIRPRPPISSASVDPGACLRVVRQRIRQVIDAADIVELVPAAARGGAGSSPGVRATALAQALVVFAQPVQRLDIGRRGGVDQVVALLDVGAKVVEAALDAVVAGRVRVAIIRRGVSVGRLPERRGLAVRVAF